MSEKALTVSEKLVLSAASLEADEMKPFSAEALVVRAWEKFPDAFGLVGYPNSSGSPRFPDSNRVFSEIMGSKPLRKRGLLQKVGSKKYCLTESGRELARMLARRGGSAPSRSTVPRETKAQIERLLNSRAYAKYANGEGKAITFYDACAFWGISPRSSAMDFTAHQGHVEALFRAGIESLRGEEAQVLTHGGRELSRDAIGGLEAVHSFMLDRFADELKVILGRTDER